ncbi:MAG: DMT family transporter [Acidiferrobacterales bacterium]|nr:DMT family transporter [Acidiferrobacterales bacterium]
MFTAGSISRAYLLLVITTLCWGGNAVFGRLAVGEISPMVVVMLRWAGAVLLLFMIARHKLYRDWPILKPRVGYLCLMGAIGFTIFNALFYAAAHSTTALNIGIIQGGIPVFVLIGMFFIYRITISGLQFVGVIITLLGVFIVASAGDPTILFHSEINRGDLLMLLACFCYGAYAVGLREKPNASAMAIFLLMAMSALVTSVPFVVVEFVAGGLQWPTPRGWGIIGLITLFPSFIAQLCFIQGVEILGPGRAGVFVNLVPVFASIFAVAFLGEAFQSYHALALCLVLGGIWLSERFKK